jgi:ssRNA-specific RNase YbeY (16S rRNA maturation enzyme)
VKAPALDIHVESELWERRPDAAAIVARAAAAVAAETAFRPDDEIGVLLVDDAAILALNARWRDQAKPTNVLSFPAPRSVAPGAPCFLGDIVLAFETIEREARAEGKPWMRISRILPCTASCIFADMITRRKPRRKPWKGSRPASSRRWASQIRMRPWLIERA